MTRFFLNLENKKEDYVQVIGSYNEKRNYIDYDEFSHVLWTTNIDKTCCIDFIDH